MAWDPPVYAILHLFPPFVNGDLWRWRRVDGVFDTARLGDLVYARAFVLGHDGLATAQRILRRGGARGVAIQQTGVKYNEPPAAEQTLAIVVQSWLSQVPDRQRGLAVMPPEAITMVIRGLSGAPSDPAYRPRLAVGAMYRVEEDRSRRVPPGQNYPLSARKVQVSFGAWLALHLP